MNALRRSTVVHELALRPGFSAQARMPSTALRAPRGVRRGLLVLTAGSVPYFYRRYATGTVASPLHERAGVLTLLLPRGPRQRDREGLKILTRTEHNWAARRRGELTRDRGSRRLSPTIDARRRLNARRAVGTRTKADPFGPNDSRYAWLTRS
jgi:hypothetical protein